jgi:hypothetical protein
MRKSAIRCRRDDHRQRRDGGDAGSDDQRLCVDEAGKEATFVVTLDRPSTGVVSMNYATQDGGALAGSDYVATSGSLNFAAGETAKTVKVTLLNDTAPESSEAFNLVLSALSGATTLDPVGTAIIAENDAAAVSTSNIW